LIAPDAFSEREWRLDPDTHKFAALYEETFPGSRVLKPGMVQPTKLKWADEKGEVHISVMAQPRSPAYVVNRDNTWYAHCEWGLPGVGVKHDVKQKDF
jgi:hypothetical protein